MISVYVPPKPVGFWQLDDGPEGGPGTTWISMRKKPTDQQIKNIEESFGWKWIDAKNE